MINDYKKLTIGKYYEIQEAQNDDSLDDVTRTATFLSILSDEPVDDILLKPLDEFSSMTAQMQFIYYPLPEPQPNRIAKKYVVGGYTLVPLMDIRKMVVVQYTDYQSYLNDLDRNRVEILSCMLVPEGKRYGEDYDVLDVQEAIRENLSIIDAQNVTAFFLESLIRSIRVSLRSCIWRTRVTKGIDRKMKMSMIQELKKSVRSFENGVGLTRYTRFPSATDAVGARQ